MKTSSVCSHLFKFAGWLICLTLICLPMRGARAARLGDQSPAFTTIQAAIDAAQDGDTIDNPGGNL
jgi:hypothetical protein